MPTLATAFVRDGGQVLKEEASRNHGHAQSLLLGLDDMLGNNPMSNTFDFETGAGAGSGGKKEGNGSLGLSESLADWRKRLDDGADSGQEVAR